MVTLPTPKLPGVVMPRVAMPTGDDQATDRLASLSTRAPAGADATSSPLMDPEDAGWPAMTYAMTAADPRQTYQDMNPMPEHNLHNPMWDAFLDRLSAATTKKPKAQ